MKIDQLKAAVRAHQDQEIEDAKRWMRGDGRPEEGMLNAQIAPLWEYCCLDHPNPLDDMMSRFALIGIRHVMEKMK